MPGKIIFLSAALLAFIVFGIVSTFAQTKLTEFDAVDTYVSRKMKELGPVATQSVQGDIYELTQSVPRSKSLFK